jgi:hypothetical protein
LKKNPIVIRLGAAGRTIHVPGCAPLLADSQDGKRAIRLIKDAIEMRRGRGK